MKKNLLFSMMVLSVLIPAAQAALTFLPETDFGDYSGYSTFNQNGVSGFLEFAVYDTDIQSLSELESFASYNEQHYVYAYQVFNTSDVAVTSFELFGFNPDAFTEDDMDAMETLGGADSYGVDSEAALLSDDAAVWVFEGGALVSNETSFFLVIFSDYAPTIGTYEVNSPSSDGYVPGGENGGEQVPEPATLILLAGGAVLSLKRRRKRA